MTNNVLEAATADTAEVSFCSLTKVFCLTDEDPQSYVDHCAARDTACVRHDDGDVLDFGNGVVAIMVNNLPTYFSGNFTGFCTLKDGLTFESLGGIYPLAAAEARTLAVPVHNVYGESAKRPLRVLANGQPSIPTNSIQHAKAMRLEMINDGYEDVSIVDDQMIEVVDAEIEAHEALIAYGFTAGHRCPDISPMFAGAFMVCDAIDRDGYCIVGDDLTAMIFEALRHHNPKWNEQRKPRPGVIPANVVRMLRFHLQRLVDEVTALEGVVRARGHGQHLHLERQDREEPIHRAVNKLEVLHSLAVANGCEAHFLHLARKHTKSASMTLVSNSLPDWIQ